MTKNFADMSDEELVALNQKLGLEQDRIRLERINLSKILRERATAKEAVQKALADGTATIEYDGRGNALVRMPLPKVGVVSPAAKK